MPGRTSKERCADPETLHHHRRGYDSLQLIYDTVEPRSGLLDVTYIILLYLTAEKRHLERPLSCHCIDNHDQAKETIVSSFLLLNGRNEFAQHFLESSSSPRVPYFVVHISFSP